MRHVVMRTLTLLVLAASAGVSARAQARAMGEVGRQTLPTTVALSAYAEVGTMSPATGIDRDLTSVEMAATVGAGFWSSLWNAVKDVGELVIIAGVLWLVEEFCSLDQVSCLVT